MLDPRKLETDGPNLKIKLLLRGGAMAAASLIFGYIIARLVLSWIGS